ncbi:MAG: Protein-glutamine gamma-glutamyltransferase [Chloroflexi bacterium ADurb.Bin325]|nr:MAG: Protein-glutamine gamma-glutamyltransferase [Chloroflexi bacterium ADurb.Bin325]
MALDDIRVPATYVEAPFGQTPAERLARGGGWWTLTLTAVMLLAVTEALVAAEWTSWLEVVRLAMLGGALLAFLLSLTQWDGLFPAVYGIVASLAWSVLLFKALVFKDLSAAEAFRELLMRNANWLAALVGGTASADNLIFVTQLALLGWWIGFLAIWSLYRHQNVLYAVLPAGAALLVNAYYTTANMTPYLVTFLGAVLLIAIRVELARNEARWQMTRVRYAPDIALDFLKAGLGFAVVVIVAAWLLPNAAEHLTAERLLRPFEKPWQQVEETWNRMYKALNYSRSAAPVSSFGKSMALGGAISLSDRLIFEADTSERTYWRAATYDVYTGEGWLDTDSDLVIIEGGAPLNEPATAARREITTTIRPLEERQVTVFAPPQPVRVSVPINATVTRLPGEKELQQVSLMQSRVDLAQEKAYRVVSAVSTAPVADLMQDDATAYPGWVTERYLQLPDTLPARVRDLAAEVAAPYETAFEKAEVIQAYLRTYTYNQDIEAPPEGRDGVDYFLFDSKEGYCDYYASAMVVMLRSLGIPARIVAGYTPGEPILLTENAQEAIMQGRNPGEPIGYRVREKHAHSWPEAYFPSFGWIQFEPTASEPLLARPLPPVDPLEAGLTPKPNANNSGERPRENDPFFDMPEAPDEYVETAGPVSRWFEQNWGWLAAGGVFVAAVALAALRWRRQTRAFFEAHGLLLRLFSVLGLWARRLRIPWQPSQTPLERAAQFDAKLPEAAPAVDTIAGLFVAQQYGRQEPSPGALAEVIASWRSLQPRLWRQWVVGEIRARTSERPRRP